MCVACGWLAHIAPEKWGHDDSGRSDAQSLVRSRFLTRTSADQGQLSWSEDHLHKSRGELEQASELCTDARVLPPSNFSSECTNPLRAVDADPRKDADSGVRRRCCGVQTLKHSHGC